MAEEAGTPVADSAPAAISFVDADGGTDGANAILDEVLSGAAPSTEVPEKTDAAPEEGASKAEPAKPEPAKEPPPADAEAVRLRKGFAKLAEERQKVVELQNAARAERAAAQSFAEKAKAHDELIAALEKDPYTLLEAKGWINKVLQGAIDAEKSPEARRLDEFERRSKAERDELAAKEQARVVETWRNGIVEKVKADERFDLVNSLGLHGEVIDVITEYYEKYSEKNDKGEVVVPAVLPWETAAQAVEETRAAKLEASKRYGKRAPVAAEPKDAPKAKETPAPAKRAPTSLSSVPVAETPHKDEEFSNDDMEQRYHQVLASLNLT